MLKQIKEDAIEEPLTSSDGEEDVEESRKDAKHRRRKQLLKSMMTIGKLIDEKMKGQTEEVIPESLTLHSTILTQTAAKMARYQKFQLKNAVSDLTSSLGTKSTWT